MKNQHAVPTRNIRSREVIEKIEEWIVRKIFLPGERLPAERKLAVELQVSRGAIREAFLLLEEKGYIEIKRGVKGGAYVKKQPKVPLHGKDSTAPDITLYTVDQVAEFRKAIEVSVAALAAMKADTSDIISLKSLVDSVRSHIGRGCDSVDEFIEADKAVHLKIAQIADNPLIYEMIVATLGLESYFQRFHVLDSELMEENVRDLERIVSAIEQHQPEVAGCICGEHIIRFNSTVQ